MATPVANSVGLTGNPLIDGLVQGSSWTFSNAQHQLTYSLNLNFDFDAQGQPYAGQGGTWAANPALAGAVTRALAAWANVANISFNQVTSGTYLFQSTADLALALTGSDLQQSVSAVALGFFPDPAYATALLDDFGYSRTTYPRPEGDVLLDNFYGGFNNLSDGGTGYWTILHELGHALGLKHPFDDGGNGRPTFLQSSNSQYDIVRYTVMSYNITSGYAATPMPLDIQAIQQIYGANLAYHTGNDVYLPVADGAVRTIWDAGGTDTIDLSNMVRGANVDLRPGAFTELGDSSWLAIAYNCAIENAIGSAYDDWLLGNAGSNVLTGMAGDNVYFGFQGDDTYIVSSANDLVKEISNEGTDTVLSSVTYSFLMGALQSIEYIQLTGSDNINAVGNQATIRIDGNSGNNQIDDGFNAMTLLAGGIGNDTYIVRNSTDAVVENSGEGTDTVVLWAVPLYVLPANVENLSLHVTYTFAAVNLSGNVLNNTILGGGLDDTLAGGDGNDSLSGGSGFDSMLGGVGNDTLRGGDQGDYMSGGVGNDYLSGGKGLDTMTGGDGDDQLVGLLGSDTITGDAGFDFLDGGDGDDNLNGGTNGDTLLGGAGNDILGGGNGLDSLDGGEGNDTLTGGLGTDTLTGGAGADHFTFKHQLNATSNVDTITDFATGVDVIELLASIFGVFNGVLGQTMGVSANLLYDAGTGVLAYDADGAGLGTPVNFAILGASIHPATLGNDFLIVA